MIAIKPKLRDAVAFAVSLPTDQAHLCGYSSRVVGHRDRLAIHQPEAPESYLLLEGTNAGSTRSGNDRKLTVDEEKATRKRSSAILYRKARS
jgi:hypothetical protein